MVNKLKASWVQSTTNEFANQKEGYRMVNSRPCETARPQFQNSWNKIENPRLKITRNQTSRPIWNRRWRFQERAFRDPHIWSSHSIPLKGFIVLDCLRQIAHNISFIDNFKHKITLEGHSETLYWVQQNEELYLQSIDKEVNHFLSEIQCGHYYECRVTDLWCGSHVVELIKWTYGDLYVSRLLSF